MESVVFEGQVSVYDGRPFVKMTCALKDGTPVFAAQFPPDVMTALGLRAIQAAIEAERDAGLVGWVQQEFGPQVGGLEGEEAKSFAAMTLDGLRRHRQQFDAAAGTMRPLGPDDPSEVTDG